MTIYSAEQIKKWDAFTIENKSISSIDLMEQAAEECTEYIQANYPLESSYSIYCGPGNNGGDGLAMARIMQSDYMPVTVYLLSSKIGSREYEINLKKFKKMGGKVIYLKEDSVLEREDDDIIIDAIFGIGLNKPAEGLYRRVIEFINDSYLDVISIDIPSGMFADKSSVGCEVIRAEKTLTFQQKKRAFYMRENAENLGEIEVLDIGLAPDFYLREDSPYWAFTRSDGYLMPYDRSPFAHKGDFGHACLITGSYGMMGASILSAYGCLRSGVGKLTCYTCGSGYNIMQTSVPEAMVRTSGEGFITEVKDPGDFDVIGVGPGIGQHPEHAKWLEKIFELGKPMVIDADALNVLSKHKKLYAKIPANSILTPHPKEFERLFGETKNEFEQQDLAMKMSVKYRIYIILKGHFTFISSPDGKGCYNTNGNSGMATAGSGDVLTGIITGLLAQKYTTERAAVFGVFLHGLAGDLAAKTISEEALTASDIHQHIGKAYLELTNHDFLADLDEDDMDFDPDNPFGDLDFEDDDLFMNLLEGDPDDE